MKYRKKPVVVEAIQYTGKNLYDCLCFMNCIASQNEPCNSYSISGDELGIKTLEGTMLASVGDYIIKGVNGEFYPCKPDIFEKTYEKVEVKRMKALDKLADIQYLINEFYSTDEDREGLSESAKESRKIFNQYCADIKKHLKALEIIKKKKVSVVELKYALSLTQYNNAISFMMFYRKEYELTQEEFELLKEVLSDDV